MLKFNTNSETVFRWTYAQTRCGNMICLFTLNGSVETSRLVRSCLTVSTASFEKGCGQAKITNLSDSTNFLYLLSTCTCTCQANNNLTLLSTFQVMRGHGCYSVYLSIYMHDMYGAGTIAQVPNGMFKFKY